VSAKVRLSVVVWLAAVIGTSVWFLLRAGRARGELCNVIVISIDTCRADHLSCYGYPRNITPNIDAFAKEAVVFENVISPVPLTLPGHSSMLTGTNPPYHGVHDNFNYQLTPYNITLAEILREQGYLTGGIVSAFVLDEQFGLNQGFDDYYDDYERPKDDIDNGQTGGETSRLACEWLGEHKDESFFLFLHYYDPHFPYRPPEPFASEFADNPYAGEVAYTDYCIGQVIKKLKELNLYESALIVITSDHGEMLGEHGATTHSWFIYQSALRVPLMVRVPKGPGGKRVDCIAGLVDIVPSICSYLGIEVPLVVHGRDLSGYFVGKGKPSTDRYIYCESLTPTKLEGNSLLGVVSGGWKYIQTTRPELYDLVRDAGETDNQVLKLPKRAHLMQEHLKLILEEQSYRGEGDSGLTLNSEARERLESLGYIDSGGMDDSYEFDQSKTDPKDLVGSSEKFRDLHLLIIAGRYEQAKLLAAELLAESPDLLLVHFKLGEIAFKSGDMHEVIMRYSELLSRVGKEGQTRKAQNMIHDAQYKLALAFLRLERFEEAIGHFRKALEIRADKPAVHSNLAVALVQTDRFDEAIDHCNKALRLEPATDTLLDIHDCMARAYFHQGSYERAFEHWSQMLELDPSQPAVLSDMGMAMAHQGKLSEAIEWWKESLHLEPNQAEVLGKIGTALAYQNRLDEAIEYWNKSLGLDPNRAEVHKKMGTALSNQGELDGAIECWNKSLRLDHNQPALHVDIGGIFHQKGDSEKAIYHWRTALGLLPDQSGVLNNLAWLLATEEDARLRDPSEAVRLAERACKLTGDEEPALLDTLSVAYAAAGKYSEAIEAAEKAIVLALSAGRNEMAEDIQKRMEFYRKGQPYRRPGFPY
jgi:arylsulfatase A-like enzyme/Flp pilus assembly protein TadD